MQKRLEKLLNDVSKSSEIDRGDLTAAANMILEAVIEGLNVNRSGIWLFDENIPGIRCYLLKDLTLELSEEELILKRDDFPKYFKSLDEERVIAAHDAINANETSEFAVGYLDVLDITSMLDTPIRHSGKTVGIICTEHRGDQRTWTDDEIVFAGVLSDLFGRAISAREKLDYELQLIESNKNLEAVVQERTQYLHQTISELKATQDKLIESEKMAALGNMVAGVAHEVNTPLGNALTATSYIKDAINKLNRVFKDQSMTKTDLKNFITDAQNATDLSIINLDKAATLITNFKRTSADQNHFEKDGVDLKEYIEKVLSTLVPITNKIGVDIQVLGDAIHVETYPGAISQVITNFVTNSCMHGFAKEFQGSPKILLNLYRDDEYLMVEYSDNGLGMSEDIRKKMFDPFFTTKRNDGGTGLGLSILHTLITKKLHGEISVESEINKGTKFLLKFSDI